MTFSPDQPLQNGTNYEIVLQRAASRTWRATPSPASTGPPSPPRAPRPPHPRRPRRAPSPPPTRRYRERGDPAGHQPRRRYSYAWKFGDGATGTGASVATSYARPRPLSVTLTMTSRGVERQIYEAETAALAGGILASTNVAGFTGTGYTDYPTTFGAGVKVTFNVSAPRPPPTPSRSATPTSGTHRPPAPSCSSTGGQGQHRQLPAHGRVDHLEHHQPQRHPVGGRQHHRARGQCRRGRSEPGSA